MDPNKNLITLIEELQTKIKILENKINLIDIKVEAMTRDVYPGLEYD